MEYISAEEFLKQPEEVQEVFIDWWKPSIGDLVNKKVYIHGREYNKVGCIDYEWWNDIQESNDININDLDEIKQFVVDYISDFSLLTEGQLRQFIEDKTHKIAIIEFDYDHYNLVLTNGYVFKTDKKDLLQAYWEVALEIAKEKVKS